MAYQHYGIEPDIMTVAKGLQVGAVVYDKLFDPDEPECFPALGEAEAELIWQ